MRTLVVVIAVVVAVVRIGAASARADPVGMMPGATLSNLRVDVRCAEGVAMPEHGLGVVVDGVPLVAAGTSAVPTIIESEDGPVLGWLDQGVSYRGTPGRHRVEIAAPGCASEAQDLDVPVVGAAIVEGRLATADPSLAGTVGAPDGIGFMVGGFAGRRPGRTGTTSELGDAYAYALDAGSIRGARSEVSLEHRRFVFAWDNAVGYGSPSGSMHQVGSAGGSAVDASPIAITQHVLQTSSVLRFGGRLPLDTIAIAAGTGVGGDLWFELSDDAPGHRPIHIDRDPEIAWFVPLWVEVTVKPACDWGLQVIASYDLHPTDLAASTPSIGAGLLLQPSSSCAQRPGLQVR